MDEGLADAEKVFSYFGYVPFISTCSGSIRHCFAAIEIVVGIAGMIFNILKALFSEDLRSKKFFLNEIYFILRNYVAHGMANIIRGQFELIPFVNLICVL